MNDVRTCQRIGQRAGQAGLIGEHPGDHTAGVRHDVITADFDVKVSGQLVVCI